MPRPSFVMQPAPPHPPLPPPLYGLDIETDTSVDGLDPARSSIVSVAVSGDDDTVTRVFEAPARPDEHPMLHELDRYLAGLAPGILVTWNGSGFDLPFLADRAACHDMHLGLELWPDPSIATTRPPLAGHEARYRGRWHHHRHLDAYPVYRADVGPLLRVSCGLKNMAKLAGLAPLEVDRTMLHKLSRAEVLAYVASDARVTRLLAARRWPAIGRHVDRGPSTGRPAPVAGKTVTAQT